VDTFFTFIALHCGKPTKEVGPASVPNAINLPKSALNSLALPDPKDPVEEGVMIVSMRIIGVYVPMRTNQ
jgi:hypothetical protein